MKLHELFKYRFDKMNVDINRVKIVRHIGKDINKLIERDLFEYYQCLNKKRRFECDYLISFIGLESTKALFWNVYKVDGEIPPQIRPNFEEYKKEFPQSFNYNTDSIYYNLVKEDGFEDMHRRLVIEWGNSARQWVQNYNSRAIEIIEIKPSSFNKEFPGYLEFTLTYKELEEFINNPIKYYIWKDKLSSVFGIYLLVDIETGLQYIGAAYNEDGIWGRWENHIKTNFSGSNIIKELIEENKIKKYDFQFTILEILPNYSNKNQVLEREKLYKQKLRTKEGFNLN